MLKSKVETCWDKIQWRFLGQEKSLIGWELFWELGRFLGASTSRKREFGKIFPKNREFLIKIVLN
jgi:hypothetical protein